MSCLLMMTLSPILSLSVAMVAMSSPADGVPVCEDPVLAMEWMEGAEDLLWSGWRGQKTCYGVDGGGRRLAMEWMEGAEDLLWSGWRGQKTWRQELDAIIKTVICTHATTYSAQLHCAHNYCLLVYHSFIGLIFSLFICFLGWLCISIELLLP